MTKDEFRTGVYVAVSVFLRKVGLTQGRLSEEDLWEQFDQFVRDSGLSKIVSDEADDDIPF